MKQKNQKKQGKTLPASKDANLTQSTPVGGQQQEYPASKKDKSESNSPVPASMSRPSESTPGPVGADSKLAKGTSGATKSGQRAARGR